MRVPLQELQRGPQGLKLVEFESLDCTSAPWSRPIGLVVSTSITMAENVAMEESGRIGHGSDLETLQTNFVIPFVPAKIGYIVQILFNC